MRKRLIASLNVLLVVTAVTLALPLANFAQAQNQGQTAPTADDVIYKTDGTKLTGKVVSETSSHVVFDYRDPNVKITARLTIAKSEIAHIERAAEAKPEETQPKAEPNDAPKEPTGPAPSLVKPRQSKYLPPIEDQYGTRRVQNNNEVPSIYIIPMKGQMGTDICASVYEEVVKDVRLHKPDVIVIEMQCSDTSEMMSPEGYNRIPGLSPMREWGMLDFGDFRDMVHILRDQLSDIKQVVWVRDSDGIAATVAMAWTDIYMAPNARFGSKYSLLDRSGASRWQDPDVRAKMIAAWLGIAKGFVEKGGHSLELAHAMLDSKAVLSGKWRGRNVNWTLDEEGDYVIDTSDKHTATFSAKSAEDFCISQGMAHDIDDLALLLGFREYRLIQGRQYDLTSGYVEKWRKEYQITQVKLRDYIQHMGWAQGADAVKFLGRAKDDLEYIVTAMNKYKAIQTRWEQDFGISKFELEIRIEQLKEELTALRNRSRPGGGGGGRRGGGSGVGM